MGRKKKQWINKKTASTFRVVHRNYQDPLWGTENRSDFVLEPVPNLNALKKGIPQPTIEDAEKLFFDKSNPSNVLTNDDNEEEISIEAYGFPDDGYDYSKHLKPMGGGTFIPAEITESGTLFGLPPLIEDIETKGIIGGSEEFLPKDVLDQLHGNVEYDLDDLQDDFLVEADASASDFDDDYDNDLPPPLECDYEYEDDDDNFDNNYEPDDEFAKGKKIKDRKLIYVASMEKFDNVIDKQFNEIADEYDDDLIGELDENDPSVKGTLDLSQLGYILDEFLEENSPVKLKLDSRIVPKTLVNNIPCDIEAVNVEEDDNEEDTLEGYDYLSSFNAPQKEQWDCESILSTYSNLYNHPTIIDDTPKRQIKLSKKTGMPVDYIGIPNNFINNDESSDEEYEDDNISTVSTNLGERRPKKETKEEKLARKKLVKEERKKRREEKKLNKQMFKKEEVRQVQAQIKTKNPAGIKL